MTSAVALRQTASPIRTRAQRRSTGKPTSLFDDPGGEPTLDEYIAGVWEGLTARANATCPICSQLLKPEYGAHARPIAGRCENCGSRLS